MSDVTKKVKVTQIASGFGRKPGQQATLVGLGLNKIRRTRELRGYALGARHDPQGGASGEGRGAVLTRPRRRADGREVR